MKTQGGGWTVRWIATAGAFLNTDFVYHAAQKLPQHADDVSPFPYKAPIGKRLGAFGNGAQDPRRRRFLFGCRKTTGIESAIVTDAFEQFLNNERDSCGDHNPRGENGAVVSNTAGTCSRSCGPEASWRSGVQYVRVRASENVPNRYGCGAAGCSAPFSYNEDYGFGDGSSPGRLFQLRFGDGQCTSTATAWGGPSNANGGNAVVAACAGEKYSDAAEADAKGVRFWMAEREE